MVITKSFKIKYCCFFSFGLEEKTFNRGHLAEEGKSQSIHNTIKLTESQALIADVAYFGLTVLKHSGFQNLN